jgi:hypothetical protein
MSRILLGVCDGAQLKRGALICDKVVLNTVILLPRLYGERFALEVPHELRVQWSTEEYLLACAGRNPDVTTVPVLDAESQMEWVPAGNVIAYAAAIANLPIVATDDAAWDQIIEFRNDPDACGKYRDLRLWLQTGLKAESVQQATDIIAKKLEDYEWAITKHGLKSTIGNMKQIIDLTATPPAGLAYLLTGKVWAALMTGGLVIAAKVVLSVAEQRIDLSDVKRGKDSEIAILYDIKKKLGSG